MNQNSAPKPPSRRDLLIRSATVLALPAIVPASALGRAGRPAPSERIVLGAIGIGPRGRDVLGYMLAEPDVQFVAISDVRADRRASVKAMADSRYGNQDCAMYRDFREMLTRPDIDAVLIATGDRWHALASILAAKAGKDVYSEKPCTLTLAEGALLADTFRRYGRVFQAGTQRRSIPNFQAAARLAQSGKLGKLHTVHASIYQLGINFGWLPAEPEPPKEVVDWDLWLGPAPWRPFNRQYINGGWRGFYDFDSGNRLLDWGAHTLDLCQWAAGKDGTTPVEFTPDGGSVRAVYADGLKAVLRPDGWIPGLGTCPVRFEGDEGWIETGDNARIEVHPKSLMSELEAVKRMAGTDPAGHGRNFFDCVKSRARTACNADVTRSSHVACHAAAIAWQLGRTVRFDPKTETFIGDEEANRLRSRAMREPWRA